MSGAIRTVGQTPAVLGVLMLDTLFPRPKGDVGHAETFGVPMHYDIFKGVWPVKVVACASSLHQARLVPGFQHMVRLMQARGVQAVTTSCGFLVLLQKELQSVVKIPVVTSSLLQLPAALAKERQVGVLTISASALGKEHLRAAGVPKDRLNDVFIQGMPRESHFAIQILSNQSTLDFERARNEVVAAALALKARAPQLQTVVLECTNMPPYQAALEQATGWKLLSLQTDPRLRKVIDATIAPVPSAEQAHNTPSSGDVS
jgi:hypothetical protein